LLLIVASATILAISMGTSRWGMSAGPRSSLSARPRARVLLSDQGAWPRRFASLRKLSKRCFPAENGAGTTKEMRSACSPVTGLDALAIRNQPRTYFTDEVSRKAKVAHKSVRFDEGGLAEHLSAEGLNWRPEHSAHLGSLFSALKVGPGGDPALWYWRFLASHGVRETME
jgi:hypothetical protein